MFILASTTMEIMHIMYIWMMLALVHRLSALPQLTSQKQILLLLELTLMGLPNVDSFFDIFVVPEFDPPPGTRNNTNHF